MINNILRYVQHPHLQGFRIIELCTLKIRVIWIMIKDVLLNYMKSPAKNNRRNLYIMNLQY